MANEQLKVFTGGGKTIENEFNIFLKEYGDNIEVISFQAVENPSMSGSSLDGHHVAYLLYRISKK
jgi:hypothetical protein